MLRFCTQGGKASLDLQPHWVSSLAWPEEEAGSLWGGEPRELLLVGRMDGTLGLLEVLDDSDLQRTELQHCFRKDGTDGFYETVNKTTFGKFSCVCIHVCCSSLQWLWCRSHGTVRIVPLQLDMLMEGFWLVLRSLQRMDLWWLSMPTRLESSRFIINWHTRTSTHSCM